MIFILYLYFLVDHKGNFVAKQYQVFDDKHQCELVRRQVAMRKDVSFAECVRVK